MLSRLADLLLALGLLLFGALIGAGVGWLAHERLARDDAERRAEAWERVYATQHDAHLILAAARADSTLAREIRGRATNEREAVRRLLEDLEKRHEEKRRAGR